MNKWEEARALGLDPGRAVITRLVAKQKPRIIPPLPPPTKCGEYTWFKCGKCRRYYNAPKEMETCVLCQHKALG